MKLICDRILSRREGPKERHTRRFIVIPASITNGPGGDRRDPDHRIIGSLTGLRNALKC